MVGILEVSKQQHRKNGVDNDGSRDNSYKGGVNDSLQNYCIVQDTNNGFMLGHI